ncbi:RHS repeat-associated core domain-containing protein [Pseudomonas sp. Q12-87]|uniref:RHS repeat-associated core domain-containing protein n=1 Tax=Pseudomonas sp. Q12-87 TaxID=177989 RepID=UPI00069D8048|nr:RHS repeat-associated core domain-containing protein [Pseudomonas sp. Q12-87]
MADSDLGSNHPITNFGASPDEPTTRFHYDALDSLIGRTTSEGKEHRFYRNDELASEVSGTVSTTFVRAEGVVLAECQTGGDASPILLMGDDKNSVMGEVTRRGLTSIAYSPYGHRVEGSSANSHLGYNGERRETQSGWYFLGNGYRVFNPRLMRFHSPDNLSPFGKGGLNAYMYCEGDPINNVDPTGHVSFGGLIRFFTNTTASAKYRPGSTSIPESFLRTNPDKAGLGIASPASIKKIRPKDVAVLKKRMGFYEDVADSRRADYLTYEFYSHPGLLDEKLAAMAEYQRSVKVLEAAKVEYQFARDHIYKSGVTRHSLRDFRIIAGADKKMIALAKGAEQEKYFKNLNLGAAEMKNIRK